MPDEPREPERVVVSVPLEFVLALADRILACHEILARLAEKKRNDV